MRFVQWVSWIARLLPFGLLLCAPVSRAALFTVSTLEDGFDGQCDAHCSLREAVAAANDNPGTDRIVLASSAYLLSLPAERDDDGDTIDEDDGVSGDLDIRDDLEIFGSGSTVTTIDGGAGDRVIEVLPGATVTLRSLGIRNGRVSQFGAGIRNDGILSLEDVLVRANRAAGVFTASAGGGIYNAGTLTLAATTIDGNRTNSGEGGHGLGAGLYNAGVLRIRERTIVSDNHGSDDDDDGSGGGLYNSGTAFIVNALFVGNSSSLNGRGGAIVNATGARLVASNVTISGNLAGDAGLRGGAAVINESGGSRGGMELRHVTIADNYGGGLTNRGKLTIAGSIVAGNVDTEGDPHAGVNCLHMTGGTTANYSSLIADDGNCMAPYRVDNGTVFDALLLPLADNGGRTRTHALPAGSVAIDASYQDCMATDQRGVRRPQDGDADGQAICDLGAYERRATASP